MWNVRRVSVECKALGLENFEKSVSQLMSFCFDNLLEFDDVKERK